MKRSYAMLALVPDAYGGRGGIAQYNRDFLGALAESGLLSSITVLPRQTIDHPDPPRGIQQLRAHAGRFWYSLAALRMALARRIDVVFCGHLFMAPLAALIAWTKGAKLIVQTHGIEAWPRPSKLQRLAVERADLVLSVSRYTRAAVLGWAAIAPERALVVPNTVREMFTTGDGAARRAALGLDGKKVLLTVGRLVVGERYKGHDRVMAAIPQLVGQGHDICYLIVGDGDDRSRLEALAAEIGVGDRVRFLGAVDPQTLLQTYRAADLFVMPSTGEGFGVSFLEAMASGTPALGLDVAGARDALGDGELGTLVFEGDLTATIVRVLDRPKSNPVALHEHVCERYGRRTFATTIRACLDRVFVLRDVDVREAKLEFPQPSEFCEPTEQRRYGHD
jgi:phosphatidylinositol alpha-1,6-mannosyltransferase